MPNAPPLFVVAARLGESKQQHRSRIAGRIERMAETWQLLTAPQPVRDRGARIGRRVGFREQHLHALAGAAVLVSLQRGHRAPRPRRTARRRRTPRTAARKRRHVQLVVGAQDQRRSNHARRRHAAAAPTSAAAPRGPGRCAMTRRDDRRQQAGRCERRWIATAAGRRSYDAQVDRARRPAGAVCISASRIRDPRPQPRQVSREGQRRRLLEQRGAAPLSSAAQSSAAASSSARCRGERHRIAAAVEQSSVVNQRDARLRAPVRPSAGRARPPSPDRAAALSGPAAARRPRGSSGARAAGRDRLRPQLAAAGVRVERRRASRRAWSPPAAAVR